VSPPSHCAGALLYRFIGRAGAYIYIMSSGDTTFWSPRAPALRANVKPARSLPVTWGIRKDLLLSELACLTKVLASVLRLTIRTTPVPYPVTAGSATTVRCVVTRGKLGAHAVRLLIVSRGRTRARLTRGKLGAHAVGLLIVCRGRTRARLETATSL